VAGTAGAALTAKDDDPRVYVRILTHVREQIADGTMEPGGPTPPIGAFCEQFGCARTTAGKAMRKLAKEGLVVRYPGLGYYVAHRSDDPAPRMPGT
jgi:DNA-binding GntR family transcriptional regulator